MTAEIYKTINDFKDYQISNLGNVKSIKRNIILKQVERNYGMTVDFCVDNKSYRRLIHRLVAEAFISNTNNYDIVKHRDNDMKNNKIDNLYWASTKIIKQDKIINPFLLDTSLKWTDISGYEGLYKISVNGDIFNCRTNKLQATRKRDYISITLTKNNKNNIYFVHTLVGLTFISQIKGKQFINHKDRNTHNNHVDNLEWVTRKENNDHARQTESINKKSVDIDQTYDNTELFDIKDYPGYKITKDGRIYSIKCKRYMKPVIHDEYLHVNLSKNNKHKGFSIHRLIALTFIPNTQNKPEVNHKDGNKQNNHVDNLEWVTKNENAIHAIETGLKQTVKVCQFTIDNKFVKLYPSVKKAEEENNANITTALTGKSQTINGYKWLYEEACIKNDDGTYSIPDEYIKLYNENIKRIQKRELCKFDKNGVFVKKYESIAQAVKDNNLHIRSLKRVLSTNKGSLNDDIWYYGDDCEFDGKTYKIKNTERKKKQQKTASIKVQQLDTSGKILKEYDSIGSAAKSNNYDNNTIKAVLNGKSDLAYGYKWIYA